MKRSWIVAGILGVVSAIVYFASLADYAFPGTSAHLMAVWQGLDTVAQVQYPLMRVFALLLGGGEIPVGQRVLHGEDALGDALVHL